MADVRVTNGLTVAPAAPITGGGGGQVCTGQCSFAVGTASALQIHMTSGVLEEQLRNGGQVVADFLGASSFGDASISLALTRPISFDEIVCIGPYR